MESSDSENVEDRLQELSQQVNDLSEKCHFRTLIRVANEARRLAKMEQHLIPYLTASFHVMNDSRNLLQPTTGRDVAIELITLLESDDRARQFQPNLPEDDYERTKWWLTACSYDNLAVNTAESNGYNSDGMHQCITDGIQVCRRTGKLQCVTCFREYATDVYVAADDLDMALHHARVGVNNVDPGPHDRRHVGAKDSVRILLLQGHVEAALEALDVAWKLSDVYHSPYAGKLDTHTRAVELFHLAGCPERLAELPRRLSAEEGEQYQGPADAVLIEPPRDEFPSYFLDRDLADSLVACCKNDYEAATALIQPWDALLRDQKCLTKWLEVRLRLVAIARMTGNIARAQALARPLADAAAQARDWQTQRRLARILDESIPATPLALSGAVAVGPFADTSRTAAVTHSADPAVATFEDDAPHADVPPSPLAATIQKLYARLMALSDNPDQAVEILAEILAIEPGSASSAETARLLHLTRFTPVDADRTPDVWKWAEVIAARHEHDPTVLSMLAALGARLQTSSDGRLSAEITDERLQRMFGQSLDMDPHAGDNFARAGSYYLEQENYGEAERCLARGFRLLRSSGFLARSLAEVYSRTDRPRDAVAVLDMALRDGCDDPEVAWDAALGALKVDQFDAALTYLDRFDELRPDQPWSNYYRAGALLELQRPEDALAALDREAQFNAELTYHVHVLRASALAGLRQEQEFRQQLETLLAVRLVDVPYLTMNGLQRMFTRLWKSTAELLEFGDPDLQRLETRLLESGLAPNELFAAHRQKSLASASGETVDFFRCLVRQPLDDRWPAFPGRLAGDDDWVSYLIPWGVLARDESEAGRLVLHWQQRCFPQPAEIVEIEPEDTGYSDSPGVVWQGYREGELNDD